MNKNYLNKVNYDHSELPYPFSIEEDIKFTRSLLKDIYFVSNIISDLINYVVFVLINLSIDIFMLVCLRSTLNEKLKRFNEMKMDTKKISQKEIEMRESMNNAIRMVILNSALNFFSKLPLAFIPMANTIATFYYKTNYYQEGNWGLHMLLWKMRANGFYYLLPDFADFLYTILISTQLFVFAKFDRKIKTGLDRCLKLVKKKKSNINSSRSRGSQTRLLSFYVEFGIYNFESLIK